MCMFICTSPQYKLVNAETAEVSMRWERRGIAAKAVCPNNIQECSCTIASSIASSRW